MFGSVSTRDGTGSILGWPRPLFFEGWPPSTIFEEYSLTLTLDLQTKHAWVNLEWSHPSLFILPHPSIQTLVDAKHGGSWWCGWWTATDGACRQAAPRVCNVAPARHIRSHCRIAAPLSRTSQFLVTESERWDNYWWLMQSTFTDSEKTH